MTRILFFADNDTTPDAPKVLDAMLKVPDVAEYDFIGDGPYSKDSSKWIAMMKKYFPDTKKLRLSQGNHEHKESESQESEDQIEAWIPSLANENDALDWLSAGQVGNVYLISMNTQDLDVEFKRDQYNYVLAELGKAQTLKKAGKINWIVVLFHKPFFTLKSSHSPYTAVRKIYNDPFVSAGVDFCVSGHNHNTQLWFPMTVDFTQEANGLGKQLFTYASDGKTFDFSKQHGPAYIVTGHAGHEWNPINDKGEGVKNVMHFRDSGLFGFTQIDFDDKKANVKSIDSSGKVHFEYNVSKDGSSMTPPSPPQDPNDSKPTSPPPGPGFKWHQKQKKWIPKLEDPSFIPDHPTPTKPTPPAKPIPTNPADPTGTKDQMGIMWLVAKGKQSLIEQSRDESTDDRWSGNVTGLMNGFEATMIAKGIGTNSSSHFAMKQFSGNHSGSGTEKNAWYDTGLRVDGTVQLQTEFPHPKNHSFTLTDKEQFIKKISKSLEGNWIGLKWSCLLVKPGGTRKDGVRCRMWIDEDPLDAQGKPANNWKLAYDFIDTGQVIPAEKQLVDEQDCEVRRSDTKSHEIYGNGLHVRAL